MLNVVTISSVQSLKSCLTLSNPMNCSTPGLPVHHQLLEFTQTHVHRVSDAIQPSHPLLSPSPPAPHSLPASGSFPVSQFIRPYNSTSKYLPKRSKWRYMSTQDTCPYRHRNNLLGRKLGTSKRGGLAEKDASWSLNSIPDMPRRAHRYAAKITRLFQLPHMHHKHTVDTN